VSEDRLADLLKRGGIVKIDGVMQAQHAVAAAEAGADLVGFIFAKSRRQLTSAQASIEVSALRTSLGERAPLVLGVFVDESPERVNEIIDEVGLDVVQLHGSETAESLRAISRPIFRAVGPPPGSSADDVAALLATLRLDAVRPALWVIDAWDPVNHGGSGKRADWAVAAELARTTPFLLAGGLNPENVAEAVRTVRPVGVDVSSGVETDGVKDPERIRAFVHAAKAAFPA
jgi:phosphoribosylanthranilate isomerase